MLFIFVHAFRVFFFNSIVYGDEHVWFSQIKSFDFLTLLWTFLYLVLQLSLNGVKQKR